MSGDSRRNRTILPRSTVNDDPTITNLETNPQTGPLRVSNLPPPRTNIRSACLACRRRRSRCTGGNPCGRCRTLETDCVYKETYDGRYRISREWGKEQLELYKRLFNGLTRAVREGREQELIELIRNEAPLEVIAQTVDDMYPETGSEGTPEAAESPSLPAQTRDESRAGTVSQLQPRAELRDVNEDVIAALTNYTAMGTFDDSLRLQNVSIIDPGSPLTSEENEFERFQSARQPLHLPPQLDTHSLSNHYIKFRDTARHMIQRGVSPNMILGDTSVSCSWLFSSQSPPFGVSGWATNIVNSVPGVDILFRLAWLCYLIRYMRWAVIPTPEHYQLMPPAMRPTALQLSVEHMAVIDLIPIPQVRDRMIEQDGDFIAALELAGATIHWTENFDDSIDQDPITGNRTISTKFENHIANIDNFCFGKSLLIHFPELAGQPQIAEVDQIVSISMLESSADPMMDYENIPEIS